jgi:dTDP-4-dehydrorhamnose 3,5-epimerase-like enzyme
MKPSCSSFQIDDLGNETASVSGLVTEEQLARNILEPRVSLKDSRVIELPKIQDHRGNLTYIESERHIPFEIKRTYYLYDVPGGSSRAAHGHKTLHQFMIAMSGSFDVTLDDGREKQLFHLNRSYYGLYIPPMMWRDLDNFSSGAVCLVLASDFYDENDYFRDYHSFLRAVRESQK